MVSQLRNGHVTARKSKHNVDIVCAVLLVHVPACHVVLQCLSTQHKAECYLLTLCFLCSDCVGCQAVIAAAMRVADNATLAKEVLDAMINNCHNMGLNKVCCFAFIVSTLSGMCVDVRGFV